jgi:hypothetical protein
MGDETAAMGKKAGGSSVNRHLTKRTRAPENPGALADVVPASRDARDVALPELPPNWVPEDTVIFGLAERDADGRWEVVLPAYTIVGVGDNIHEALHEAGELLEDYFRLCYAEGQTFEDAERHLPTRWMLPLVAKSVAFGAWQTIRHKSGATRHRLRVPLNHATC